jgi:hypothetical protein
MTDRESPADDADGHSATDDASEHGQPYLGDGLDHDADHGQVNVDVSGTVGPDHLGQETTNVRGHRYEGVYGLREVHGATPSDHQRHRTDTGSELPILLESDFRTDPIEGACGSFELLVEGECAYCGYDRLVDSRRVGPGGGEPRTRCNACEAIQAPRLDDGSAGEHGADEDSSSPAGSSPADHGRADFELPTTDAQHRRKTREYNERIGESYIAGDIYRVSDDTIALVDEDYGVTRLNDKDVSAIVDAMVREDMLDLADTDAGETLLDTVATALEIMGDGGEDDDDTELEVTDDA